MDNKREFRLRYADSGQYDEKTSAKMMESVLRHSLFDVEVEPAHQTVRTRTRPLPPIDPACWFGPSTTYSPDLLLYFHLRLVFLAKSPEERTLHLSELRRVFSTFTGSEGVLTQSELFQYVLLFLKEVVRHGPKIEYHDFPNPGYTIREEDEVISDQKEDPSKKVFSEPSWDRDDPRQYEYAAAARSLIRAHQSGREVRKQELNTVRVLGNPCVNLLLVTYLRKLLKRSQENLTIRIVFNPPGYEVIQPGNPPATQPADQEKESELGWEFCPFPRATTSEEVDLLKACADLVREQNSEAHGNLLKIMDRLSISWDPSPEGGSPAKKFAQLLLIRYEESQFELDREIQPCVPATMGYRYRLFPATPSAKNSYLEPPPGHKTPGPDLSLINVCRKVLLAGSDENRREAVQELRLRLESKRYLVQNPTLVTYAETLLSTLVKGLPLVPHPNARGFYAGQGSTEQEVLFLLANSFPRNDTAAKEEFFRRLHRLVEGSGKISLPADLLRGVRSLLDRHTRSRPLKYVLDWLRKYLAPKRDVLLLLRLPSPTPRAWDLITPPEPKEKRAPRRTSSLNPLHGGIWLHPTIEDQQELQRGVKKLSSRKKTKGKKKALKKRPKGRI